MRKHKNKEPHRSNVHRRGVKPKWAFGNHLKSFQILSRAQIPIIGWVNLISLFLPNKAGNNRFNKLTAGQNTELIAFSGRRATSIRRKLLRLEEGFKICWPE